jgi:hypothetical protein
LLGLRIYNCCRLDHMISEIKLVVISSCTRH